MSAAEDFLDLRSKDEILGDLGPLSRTLRELEAPDGEAIAKLIDQLALNKKIDPEVVRRLRSLAQVTEDGGLEGSILELTLRRAGWFDVERREISRLRSEKLSSLDAELAQKRASAEAEAALALRASEEVAEQLKLRLNEVSEEISNFESRTTDAQAIAAAAMLDLDSFRRSVAEIVRQDMETNGLNLGAQRHGTPSVSWPVGRNLKTQQEMQDALREAAATKGLSFEDLSRTFCATKAGFVALVNDKIARGVAEAISATIGAIHIEVHCDPSLLSINDLLANKQLNEAMEALSASRNRFIVLELVNLLAAPSTFWIEAIGGRRRSTRTLPENVLVIASPGSTSHPNYLVSNQISSIIQTVDDAAHQVPIDLPVETCVLEYDPLTEESVNAARMAFLKKSPADVPPEMNAGLVRFRAVADQSLGLDEAEVEKMVNEIVACHSSVLSGERELPATIAAVLGKKLSDV
ncbi:hypothetical protein ACVC7O_14645 [Roseobacter sp. A03A-229]